MPFEGYGRKSDKNIDGAAILGMLGMIQGAPALDANPAAGATKPGDVDYTYAGDPSDAIKKFGTGPLKNPSFGQTIAYPTLSSKIQGVNAEYAATPHLEAQQFAIKKGQAADMISHGYRLATGKDMPPEMLADAVGAFGTKVIGSGLSSGEIGQQMQGAEDIRLGNPNIRALNANLSGTYDTRLGERRLTTGTPEAQADYELSHSSFGAKSAQSGERTLPAEEANRVAQAKLGAATATAGMETLPIEQRLKLVQLDNSIANELKVVPAKITLARMQLAGEIGREPLEQEVRQRVLENEKNAQGVIVPATQRVQAGTLAQQEKDLPLATATQHNREVQANVMSRQPLTESNPRLFDVNLGYDQNSPVTKAYKVAGQNPAYVSQFAKFGPMMNDVNNMQGGSGGAPGALSLPGGLLAIPAPASGGTSTASTPAPQAVVRPPSITVSPQASAPTTNSPFLADHLFDKPAPGQGALSYPIGSDEQLQAMKQVAKPTLDSIAKYLYNAFNLRGEPVSAQ